VVGVNPPAVLGRWLLMPLLSTMAVVGVNPPAVLGRWLLVPLLSMMAVVGVNPLARPGRFAVSLEREERRDEEHVDMMNQIIAFLILCFVSAFFN
jgi:hypothetical protein